MTHKSNFAASRDFNVEIVHDFLFDTGWILECHILEDNLSCAYAVDRAVLGLAHIKCGWLVNNIEDRDC